MNYKTIFIIHLLFFVIAGKSFAQDGKVSKVVVVESDYKPEIESAEKMSSMPALTDTAKSSPAIEYTVLPSGLKTQYKVKPIKPAKLVGQKVGELYNSRLKLGLGNYTTPLAEFSIQNLRSDDYQVGAYVYHKSSHTKLMLADDNKVDAGYGNNELKLYGKRFYKGVNVGGDVFLNTDKYRFYGYNTEAIQDTTLDKKEIRQFYTHVGARAEVYSTVADSNDFDYRIGLQGSFFGDDYKNKESNLKIPMKFGFMVESFRVELNARYDYYSRTLDSVDSQDQVFQFKPMLVKAKDQWQLQVGANTYFTKDEDSKFHLYPEARFKFSVIDRVMEAFVGIYGKLEQNTMQEVTGKNPFVMPGLDLGYTSHKIVGYGGVQGVLSSKSGYKAEVSFRSIDNAYFFINDTVDLLGNQFIAVSDNIDVVDFSGELWFMPYSFLNLHLKGNYKSYSMTLLEKPWHQPAFSMTFGTSYNFKEKIYANFNLIQKGKRYAHDVLQPDTPLELDPIWDINLTLEYKYSPVLSAFVEANNLLAKQYHIWNQYPSQKLVVVAGFSYKF